MEPKKDVKKAYKYLNKSVQGGVTNFEQMNEYFKANYEVLAPIFKTIRPPPAEFTERKEIENLHDAYLNEL
jgi:hypothetical protein